MTVNVFHNNFYRGIDKLIEKWYNKLKISRRERPAVFKLRNNSLIFPILTEPVVSLYYIFSVKAMKPHLRALSFFLT